MPKKLPANRVARRKRFSRPPKHGRRAKQDWKSCQGEHLNSDLLGITASEGVNEVLGNINDCDIEDCAAKQQMYHPASSTDNSACNASNAATVSEPSNVTTNLKMNGECTAGAKITLTSTPQEKLPGALKDAPCSPILSFTMDTLETKPFSEVDSHSSHSIQQSEPGSTCKVSEMTWVSGLVPSKPTQYAQVEIMTSISTPLQVFPIRISPGEDLTSVLQQLIADHDLNAAFIITCVGSIKSVTLRFATDLEGQHKIRKIEENMEICSLVGTLSKDGCHLHGTFGNAMGHTVSGHIVGNMVVQTTAEVVVGHAVGTKFTRVFDARTGFRELQVQRESKD